MLVAVLIIILLGSLLLTNFLALQPLTWLQLLLPLNWISLAVILLVILACFGE